MSVREYISSLENPDFKRINMGIIERDADGDLVEYILNGCKSLNVVRYIEYVDHEYIEDERQIDLDSYVRRRKRKKNSKLHGKVVDDKDKIVTMYDSRYSELRVRFKLSCDGKSEIITRKFLIPTRDRFGYFLIKGKRFFMIYQLVDSSTYTKGQSVILKSMMPVSVIRSLEDIEDTQGNTHEGYLYKVTVFRKDINLFLFYLAKYGINAFDFMSVRQVVQFTHEEKDLENNIYFRIHRSLYLEVNREMFNQSLYLRSMIVTFMANVTNRLKEDDINCREFWIKKIGGDNSTVKKHLRYNNGMNIVMVFERMLDQSTKDILQISEYNKRDIYAVTRWLVQNFEALRRKDDVDLKNKRLRSNEYIAALFTQELSMRVKRIVDYGNSIDMTRLKDAMKIPGDIIVQKLRTSGLMKFDDKINDMDIWTKLRYTIKGPNSMGNKNPRAIASRYRDIHPSYMGSIDINVCGTSDPGASGTLTPWVKTDGLFFDGNMEPEDGVFEFEQALIGYHDILEELNDHHAIVLGEKGEEFDTYLNRLDKMQEVTNKLTITRRYISRPKDEGDTSGN